MLHYNAKVIRILKKERIKDFDHIRVLQMALNAKLI